VSPTGASANPRCCAMSSTLSAAESLAVGVISAPLFTVTLQPTQYWKHARMQGLPLSLELSVLWRGTAAAVYNETGQAALQFLTAGFLRKLILGGSCRDLTAVEDAASAAAAGVACAAYVSPVELLVIQQQRFGGSLADTCARMRRSFGMWGFARGFVATALRDGVYVTGMLSATPFLETKLRRAGLGATTGSLAGSCVAGLVAGALSCPFDCIKACMKGDMERRTYGSFMETGRLLWRQGGPGRLFHGVGWRGANLAGCFFIVSGVMRVMEPLFPRSAQSEFANFPGGLAQGLV